MRTAKPTIKPMKHQSVSLKILAKNDRVADFSDCGCVSADTEFLTPTGWKRIDQYVAGDLVAQFHPDERKITFVAPLEYIKKPCDTMLHIAPAYGTDQLLSAEHRVLYYLPSGKHETCSAAEFYEWMHAHPLNRNRRRFATTFTVEHDRVLDMREAELRVMVAVIADGHFNDSGSRYCVIRLKKARKQQRLIELLTAASIEFTQRQCGGQPEFQVFTFTAPAREKEFTPRWWAASPEQLRAVADEVAHWDGTQRKGGGASFSTFVKASADFVQYAYAASGRSATLRTAVRDRTGEGRGVMTEYVVHASTLTEVGVHDASAVQWVDNPEGFKYCFSVPTTYLLLRRNGRIFATGNTGKTFVEILDFADRRKKGSGAMLVVAPKSLLRSAWAADIKKFAPHLKVSVALAENREAAFAADADVYVTNTDAATWLAAQKPAFWKRFKDGVLAIDESTKFKHATSLRSKAMKKVAKFFKIRRIMTGTPHTNGVCDIWHQVFLLDDGARLGKSFFQFRSQVCSPMQVGPSPNMVQWVDKEGADLAVAALLADITIRHKLEECVDLPAHNIYTREYELPAKQMRVYEEMKELAVAELDGEVISAVNAAVVAGKLLQIASGAVYDGTGGYKLVDTGRYELVVDLALEAPHAIIWFNWQHQRDQLIKELTSRKVSFVTYDGQTPQKQRDVNADEFQGGFHQVMLAHPASAGHGLTWTRATRAVWAGPTYDMELFKQGYHRHYRNGQKQKTETIVVTGAGTIDEHAFERCMGKHANLVEFLGVLEAV